MKKTAIAAVIIVAAVFVAFLAYDGAVNKEYSSDFFVMNTYATAKLTGSKSKEAADEIRSLTETLDKGILSRTSENSVVSLLNVNGAGDAEKISDYLEILFDVCRKSGGAFDFTLGAVSDLWSFGSNPKLPDDSAIREALSHTGYEKLKLTENELVFGDKSAVIDFGAAGKGIALDEIKAVLFEKKIKQAVVSVGGSVLLMGDKEFTVGIRNPEGNSGSYIAKLHIPEGCVSTSGSYEQQFEANGRKYHHILDPETGYPVDNGLLSVTIISQSGILSDALSTACFVLGYEKGKALAEAYDCGVVFVADDKKIYAENGAENFIEITDDAYTLVMQ
ncbi:MAG: FAD:protein FMN transferase [Clostridia bacterium]|nr:FAD:protein FMN transferase [Clostridia bacterium]